VTGAIATSPPGSLAQYVRREFDGGDSVQTYSSRRDRAPDWAAVALRSPPTMNLDPLETPVDRLHRFFWNIIDRQGPPVSDRSAKDVVAEMFERQQAGDNT
jgi:hypothetical protein